MRVAIIGSGISGNAAAYALRKSPDIQDITVYEAENRIGGHSATVDIDYDGREIAVDTGFIVYNTLNYPNLTALFEHLGVATTDSDMSFSVSIGRGAFEWIGRTHEVFSGLFAQRRNLVNPRYLGMLLEILRFQKAAKADLVAGRIDGLSLGEYVRQGRYSNYFRDRYIVPMGAAIWSTPAEHMLDFPAKNFVSFFENHKLLHWDRPVWRTVKGGSRAYVMKLTEGFRDRYRLGDPVTGISRDAFGVTVETAAGRSDRYDHVIVATHSDQALKLLKDPSDEEARVLGAIQYRPNTVYLHRDKDLMPKRKEAWAAWNFLRESDTSEGDVCVSYSMQHLQRIDPDCPLFVTLNPPQPPRPELLFRTFTYDHPQYNAAAFAGQELLKRFNGRNRTSFAGAWTGYGFHEDGLLSGMLAAEALGAFLPWRTPKDSQPEGLRLQPAE
ncbi:MAG: FAD-dependent oxidoreductase [Methylocystis sp.]|nr:FAD-dependent oxidoreductase [Methylocystis sp.]MCA3582501.1 FAD-dependent oxidoreductase [Methylocystis sp.]MCA3588785.1 FAD-dependent oxidoreductase [Methylocystis sp.]MCA3592859.1 FAD-dependent oxidoreductase [Methylocystis sp.]